MKQNNDKKFSFEAGEGWKILAEKLPNSNWLDILNLVRTHFAACGGAADPQNSEPNRCDLKNCQRICKNIGSNFILTKSKLFMLSKNRLRIDLLVVLGIILVAIPIIIYFQVRFLTSTILFFVIPSIYLLIRKTKSVKRILVASLLFGTLFAFSFDFLAEFNNAWSWPTKENLVFPHFIFGVVPIDVMIWYFFWVFSIFVFYEHFLEHDRSDKISPHFKFAFYPGITALLGIIILFLINPDILRFDYAYLGLGIVTAFPFIFLAVRKPILLTKFLKMSLFFEILYTRQFDLL